MVKVQVNNQGKVYLANGKALVSSDSKKYGANVNTFLGDVDANGVLQQSTEQSDLVFTGVKDVADYGLNNKFSFAKVKSVSFPNLTTISGNSGCNYAFHSCTALTSVYVTNCDAATVEKIKTAVKAAGLSESIVKTSK